MQVFRAAGIEVLPVLVPLLLMIDLPGRWENAL